MHCLTLSHLCELYECTSNCYVWQCQASLELDNSPTAPLAWTYWISLYQRDPSMWSNSQFVVSRKVAASSVLVEQSNWMLGQPQQSVELRSMWRWSIVDGLVSLRSCLRGPLPTPGWDRLCVVVQSVRTSKCLVSQRLTWCFSVGWDRYWFYRLSERRPPPVECRSVHESENAAKKCV